MGCTLPCTGFSFAPDPEIEKLLEDVIKKCEEIKKTFIDKKKKVEDDFNEFIDIRKKELKQKKTNNEKITEDFIKGLNKEELDIEIKFLSQKVDEVHEIFEKGLEFAEPIKKISIDKLVEKAKKLSGAALEQINSKIEEMKKLKPVKVLNASFGKPLKTALEKQGMNKAFLSNYKKDLLNERKERRKKEREEFNIEKNEFDEDEIEIDLFSLIEDEILGDEEEDKKEKPKNYEEFIAKQIRNTLRKAKKRAEEEEQNNN